MEILLTADYAALTWAVFKGIGLGLACAAAALLLGRRLGLTRRPGKIHNWLVKLYFLYLPVVFAGLGALWLAVHAGEKEMLAVSASLRPQASTLTTEAAQQFLAELQEKYPTESLSAKDMAKLALSEQVEQRLADTLESRLSLPEFMRGARERLSELLAGFTLEAMEETLLEKTAGSTGLDVELARSLWQTDLVAGLQNGLAMDIFNNYFQNLGRAFRSKIILLGVVLLGPVVLEWFLSWYFQRRRAA